jgi:hypothetical protein
VDLEVDQIQAVTWNKQSFAHLVVDRETKDLIQALVTNQIAREQGTDIIESKGNGLVILLHGVRSFWYTPTILNRSWRTIP